jgi:hypothetical protein
MFLEGDGFKLKKKTFKSCVTFPLLFSSLKKKSQSQFGKEEKGEVSWERGYGINRGWWKHTKSMKGKEERARRSLGGDGWAMQRKSKLPHETAKTGANPML